MFKIFKKKDKKLLECFDQIKKIVLNSSDAEQVKTCLDLMYEKVSFSEDKGLGYYLENFNLYDECYKHYEGTSSFSNAAVFRDEAKTDIFIRFLVFDGIRVSESILFREKKPKTEEQQQETESKVEEQE